MATPKDVAHSTDGAPRADGPSGRRTFLKGATVAAAGLAASAFVEGATNMSTVEARGSTKLIQEQDEVCGTPSPQIERLRRILEGHGRLLEFFPRGVPANIDVLVSALVKPTEAGVLVQELLQVEGLGLNVSIFPYGIPVPDLVIVKVKTPGFGVG